MFCLFVSIFSLLSGYFVILVSPALSGTEPEESKLVLPWILNSYGSPVKRQGLAADYFCKENSDLLNYALKKPNV